MVEVGRTLARADLLKAGIHRYARYMVAGDARQLLDIWTRRLTFETVDGRREMHVHQRWDAADKSYVAIFDQTCEAGTLRPLTQSQSVTRDGVTRTKAFRFDGRRVDSVDDPGAIGSPQHETFAMPFFNWHIDMEFLQSLPLARGYAASIPFYDVGQEPPARYVYAVTGEATIAAADGTPIACWVLTFRPGEKDPPIHYWIAKRGQVLMREEAPVAGKGLLVKTLLGPEAADAD
jgi:hypothetical protein